MATAIVTQLNPLCDTGAVVICPRCGHQNEIKWAGTGVEWWPTTSHCIHYQGCYSTGDRITVEVRFA